MSVSILHKNSTHILINHSVWKSDVREQRGFNNNKLTSSGRFAGVNPKVITDLDVYSSARCCKVWAPTPPKPSCVSTKT